MERIKIVEKKREGGSRLKTFKVYIGEKEATSIITKFDIGIDVDNLNLTEVTLRCVTNNFEYIDENKQQ